MSRTIDDNKELETAFMGVWRNGEIKSAAELEMVSDSITECLKAIQEAESQFAPTIKLAKSTIKDAENSIDALCVPLDAVIKVANTLIHGWAEKLVTTDADNEADGVVEERTDATEIKPKPSVPRVTATCVTCGKVGRCAFGTQSCEDCDDNHHPHFEGEE